MKGIWVLVSIPMVILLITVGLSFADGEYGTPAVLGAMTAVAAGPVAYWWRTRSARMSVDGLPVRSK